MSGLEAVDDAEDEDGADEDDPEPEDGPLLDLAERASGKSGKPDAALLVRRRRRGRAISRNGRLHDVPLKIGFSPKIRSCFVVT